MNIRIGTRASQLARWQAEWVASTLAQHGHVCQLVFLTTQGDVGGEPLRSSGGEGLFTKEIQRALLAGEVDLAVHSLKDLPTLAVEGLCLAAVAKREACGDVLVCRDASRTIDTLPPAARIATGSPRRQAQLLAYRGDLTLGDIRGNVDTRLRKLHEEAWDALILAEAGLQRLSLGHHITQVLSMDVMLPAVGQGALGLETRTDDTETRQAIASIDHRESHLAVLAERALLQRLRAGCMAPVGAWGRIEAVSSSPSDVGAAELVLDAVVLDPRGTRQIRKQRRGPLAEPHTLGVNLAEELLTAGADELLHQSRST